MGARLRHKLLGQLRPATSGAFDAYLVPVGSQATIRLMDVVKTTSGAGTFSIYVDGDTTDGTTATELTAIAFKQPISGLTTLPILSGDRLDLGSGALVMFQNHGSGSALTIHIFGVEITT